MPYNYYFLPLRQKLDAVIECLNKMRKAGTLRCRYVIEQNTELMGLVCEMVKQDNISQWVGANALKRDQLNFMYTIMKRIFDSPLRAMLIDPKKNTYLLAEVFPKYIAYHANKRHMIIDAKVEYERKHKIEKRLRAGLPAEEPEVEEVEEEVKKNVPPPKSSKKVEIVEEEPPRPTDESEQHIKDHGRYWMMRNFFNEDEEHMLMWTEGSVRLSKFNPAVIVDLDDWILLQAYYKQGIKEADVKVQIEEYLETKRKRDLMACKKAKTEDNPIEEGKVED